MDERETRLRNDLETKSIALRTAINGKAMSMKTEEAYGLAYNELVRYGYEPKLRKKYRVR